MRGATFHAGTGAQGCQYFNPRSSCEERRGILRVRHTLSVISIHAPHARSDLFIKPVVETSTTFQSTLLMRGATPYCSKPHILTEFQSTLLMRGATSLCGLISQYEMISIHAPHARSDAVLSFASDDALISIHAPHARSDKNVLGQKVMKFISIHAPHARSDPGCIDRRRILYISIHAPHARSDCVNFRH